ncbi:MAG: hypothetical protein H0W63_03445 [Gemmatimonadaceae bacterium]|nr:hypothetical protein [Gemmatimonadaceae bacterium]
MARKSAGTAGGEDIPNRRLQDTITPELRGRVHQKGVELDGTEGAEDLDDLLIAIDRFEAAVEEKGGDLMVNMPHSSPPENPGFVLPHRKAGEAIGGYVGRVEQAAEAVERGQR